MKIKSAAKRPIKKAIRSEGEPAKRPAKRPPPKPERKRVASIELPTPDVELKYGAIDSSKKRRQGVYAHMRAHAGSVYMTHRQRPSLEELHEMEPFKQVHLGTLGKWAREDRWVERRREFHEGVYEEIRRRIGNELIQAQIKMLRDSEQLYEQTLQMLLGIEGEERPKVRSFEGLVRAHTGLISVQNEVRREVLDMVVPPVRPETAEEDEVPRVVPELSSGEARIAALAVVKARRMRVKDDGEGDA